MNIGNAAVRVMLFVGALTALAASAQAGLLLSDANALSGTNGVQTFTSTSGPNVTNSQVEYAVYTVGSFQTSFGVVASGDSTKLVYAYQMLNDIGGGANRAVKFLSVGITSGKVDGTDTVGSVDLPTRPNPLPGVSLAAPFTSAKMDYTSLGGFIPVGQESDILYFTSSYLPGSKSASVTPDGMLPVSNPVSSPVPEPTSLLFCAWVFGISTLMHRRRN